MLRKSLFCLAGLLLLLSRQAYAANADDIVGVWLNEEKDANIEVYKCADKYCGKIIWMQIPNYPADSTEGTPNTPKLDNLNPDAALKKTPRLGLTVIKDMGFLRDNRWDGGTVYDPKSGKTYSAQFTLTDPNSLELRGFVVIRLFGRTAHWTRKQ